MEGKVWVAEAWASGREFMLAMPGVVVVVVVVVV